MSALQSFAQKGDVVLGDKNLHSSLWAGLGLTQARAERFAHNNPSDLRQLLSYENLETPKIVAFEGVYSMEGHIADVPGILSATQNQNCFHVMDDAHGFGVLGADGAGVLQHFGMASERIIYMATLGKAAGVFGAFVAADESVIEWLVQRARPYIYTTAMPAMLAHAVIKSIEIIGGERALRTRLTALINQLKGAVAGLRWQLLPSATAIQPLMIGDTIEAVRVSDALAARGLLVPAIRPPTVPAGTARLRISLSAAHEPRHIEQLAQALHEIGAGT
jgi:8-amino-7-oxononanoate synthase